MLAGAYASLAAGSHVIHFRMGVNENNDSTKNLVRLEVKDSASGIILASRQIRWSEFLATNEPVDFQLAFRTATTSMPLEFQVYWDHATDAPGLTVTDVTIDGSHNWTAANLAHEIGRLDGLNSWEADPIRDTDSGYLINGPGTGELPVGSCRALFELKVDNFNWDKSKVATLYVVNSGTGKTVASRDVTRDLFPDTLYHPFALNFPAEAGQVYQFRVFWYFAPNAPRLTQRSVMVEARKTP
jgi:hypothetical protein